ncbi:hypothetical protein T11_6340 [Trichinella zimbabwensis]|uniref:Uncharacterized protein n=1 Tax=Trichinella zimbabwensis TaxID=268475 RepID=A0A0V1H2B5_9BILA|nr:hypothetical protein T11_6340 [Trichinella zimbabwensis]
MIHHASKNDRQSYSHAEEEKEKPDRQLSIQLSESELKMHRIECWQTKIVQKDIANTHKYRQGIILFSAVTIHILPLSGVRRSSGWQQAFTFHLPQIIPNSFALPSNFTNSPQNYIPSSECCLTRDSNQHAYCFTTCLATIPACWLDIGNWDTGNALYNTTLVIIRRCFLSLTCDASFPPHFSYLLAKNIVPLSALEYFSCPNDLS